MIVPKKIANLAIERGHLRNLEKLFERDFPNRYRVFTQEYESFPQGMFLEVKKVKRPMCIECGKPTAFRNYVRGYKDFCSIECGLSSKLTSKKRASTNLKRFGSTSPLGNDEVKSKFMDTMIERYGAPWAMQTSKAKEKSIATCLERYGATCHMDSKAFKKFVLENKEYIQNKREEGFIRNLGVRSPLQVAEIHSRQQASAYAVKRVKIGGKIFELQGYEAMAIRSLVKDGHRAKDIINRANQGKPSIPYLDVSGKKRMYFPDILVSDTHVVEVKGVYTLGIDSNKKVFETNMRKFQAASDQGYYVWLAVCDRHKNIVWIPRPERKTRKEILSKLSGLKRN